MRRPCDAETFYSSDTDIPKLAKCAAASERHDIKLQ